MILKTLFYLNFYANYSQEFSHRSSKSSLAVSLSSGSHCIIDLINWRKFCWLVPPRFSSDSSRETDGTETPPAPNHLPRQELEKHHRCPDGDRPTTMIKHIGCFRALLEKAKWRQTKVAHHFSNMMRWRVLAVLVNGFKQMLILKNIPDLD